MSLNQELTLNDLFSDTLRSFRVPNSDSSECLMSDFLDSTGFERHKFRMFTGAQLFLSCEKRFGGIGRKLSYGELACEAPWVEVKRGFERLAFEFLDFYHVHHILTDLVECGDRGKYGKRFYIMFDTEDMITRCLLVNTDNMIIYFVGDHGEPTNLVPGTNIFVVDS